MSSFMMDIVPCLVCDRPCVVKRGRPKRLPIDPKLGFRVYIRRKKQYESVGAMHWTCREALDEVQKTLLAKEMKYAGGGIWLVGSLRRKARTPPRRGKKPVRSER